MCDGNNDDDDDYDGFDDDGAGHIVNVELGHHFVLSAGVWDAEDDVEEGRTVEAGAVEVGFVRPSNSNATAIAAADNPFVKGSALC